MNRYKQNLFSQSELHTRKSKTYAANCSYSHYTYWLENDSSKMLKHMYMITDNNKNKTKEDFLRKVEGILFTNIDK